MKKLLILTLLLLSCIGIRAQYKFSSTITTTTTNEFVQIPAFILESIANVGIGTVTGNKLLFSPQFVLPALINNEAPAQMHFGEMKGCYARAFSTPWKHLGDYGVGISGAWDHYDKPYGFYFGLNYKSREVVFEDTEKNDRAHYISPEAGLRLMFGHDRGPFIELGAGYDYAFKYKGEMHNYGRDAVKSGACLNFGIGQWTARSVLQFNFKLPLYNFYNEDFTPDGGVTYPFKDVKRTISYFSFAYRLYVDY